MQSEDLVEKLVIKSLRFNEVPWGTLESVFHILAHPNVMTRNEVIHVTVKVNEDPLGDTSADMILNSIYNTLMRTQGQQNVQIRHNMFLDVGIGQLHNAILELKKRKTVLDWGVSGQDNVLTMTIECTSNVWDKLLEVIDTNKFMW